MSNIEPEEKTPLQLSRQLARMGTRGRGNTTNLLDSPRQRVAAAATGVAIKVPRRGHLYCAGDSTGEYIFSILYGSFKCSRVCEPGPGKEQIVSFQLQEDLLALDAVGLTHHGGSAVALEASAVCAIRLVDMCEELAVFHRVMSKQIAREQNLALLLCDSRAERRLATFLLDLAWRHHICGYSYRRFRLSMDLRDVANYLALSPECISRTMRVLKQADLIQFTEREIVLLDIAALRLLAGGQVHMDSTRTDYS